MISVFSSNYSFFILLLCHKYRSEFRIFAPQAQLFETGKDRRVKTKALFKQVVKFEQIDPLWSILGENKGGPYCRKSEIT